MKGWKNLENDFRSEYLVLSRLISSDHLDSDIREQRSIAYGQHEFRWRTPLPFSVFDRTEYMELADVIVKNRPDFIKPLLDALLMSLT